MYHLTSGEGKSRSAGSQHAPTVRSRALYHYEPLPMQLFHENSGPPYRTHVPLESLSRARATMCGIFSRLHAERLSAEEGLHQVVVELHGLRHCSSPLSSSQVRIRFMESESRLATCSTSLALRSADALSRSASFAWRSAYLRRSSFRSCLTREGGVSAPQLSISAASSVSLSIPLRLRLRPHVVQADPVGIV